MSEQIKKSDLFEGDPFADVKKTLEESLTSMKKYDEHLSSLAKSYSEVAKSIEISTSGLSKLVELEKASNTVKNETQRNNKEINATEKEKQRLQKAEETLKARLDQLSSKEAQNVAKLRAEITEQNKQIKQKIQAQRELTAEEERNLGTLEKLAIANTRLRAERQKLDLETQKGRDRLVQINAELDKNNAFIKANSDALSAQRMNVGNYSDSVKDALNQSGLFSRQLNQLSRIQNTLNAILKKNVVEQKINNTTIVNNTTSTVNNTKATVNNSTSTVNNTNIKIKNTKATKAQATATATATKATGGLSKALRVLRTALIATGIGAILVLLGSLIAYLTTTQEGSDKLSDAMAPLIGGFKAFIGVLQDLGGGVLQMVIGGFKVLFNTISIGAQRVQQGFLKMRIAWNDFTGDTEEADELRGRLKEIEDSIAESTEALRKGAEQIKQGWDASAEAITGANDRLREGARLQERINQLTRQRERNEIANTVPIAKNNLLYREQQEIINDTSKSEKERNDAILIARKAIQDNMQREMQMEREKLRLLEMEAEFNDTKRSESKEIAEQDARIFEKQAEYQRKLNTLATAEGTIRKQVNKAYQERLKIMNDTIDIEQQIAIEREQRRLTELEREGVHFSELLEQRRKIAEMEIKLEQDRFERLRKVSNWSREQEALERAKLNQRLIQLGWEFEDAQREIIESRTKTVKKTNDEIIAEEFEALERLSEQRKLINLNTIKDDEAFKQAELQREIELIDAKIALLEKYEGKEDEIRKLRIKKAEMERKGIEEIEKETITIIVQTQNQILDAYKNALNSQMELWKREEQAAKAHYDRLNALAESGAIADEDSLTDALERQERAIREQERLRVRQERAQLIQASLANVTNQMQQGKSTGEAIASTVALQAALKALFAGFQGFYKGTDNAPEGFAWVDERGAEIHTDKHGNIKDFGSDGGARLKWLDKGDKIITHEKSQDLLSATGVNVRLSDPKAKQSDEVAQLLRDTNRILKNSKQSDLTAEKVGSILTIVAKDKSGGNSRINRYKFK